MKKAVGAFVGLGLLLSGGWFWNSDLGQLVTRPWSFTDSVTNDEGTYFRLKVNVAYKGEPVEFDIVVGCKVRLIDYKDGTRTTEVGMVPVVFGKRMSDNRALVVRAPDACNENYWSSSRTADDVIPLMIIYDSADDLTFGIAYVSEDAYNGALSSLRFDSSNITRATRADFDLFRKRTENIITRNIFHSARMSREMLKADGLEQTRPFGSHCYAFDRFRIPPALQETARRSWPKDQPRFWWPGYGSPLVDALRGSSWSRDIGGVQAKWAEWGGSPTQLADEGIVRATGRGSVSLKTAGSVRSLAGSYYPVDSDFGGHKAMPAQYKDWPEYIRSNQPFIGQKIDFRGGRTRGFAYCYAPPVAMDNQPSSRGERDATSKDISDSIVVRKVDDSPVELAPKHLNKNIDIVIERDEYFFRTRSFFLEGTRSDV